MKRTLTLITILIGLCHAINAQCPGAKSCELAEVFCDVNTLDNVICSTPMMVNDYYPLPSLCFGVGVPNNLSWWAFPGTGDPLSITITANPDKCGLGLGVQAGVFEGICDGSYVWDCNASCNVTTFTLSGETDKCKLYYLWVDGCISDVCEFRIDIESAGPPPILQRPMPPVQISSGLTCDEIELCFLGYASGCRPTYQWHLNGVLVEDQIDSCASIPIPDSIRFEEQMVCLTATIGDPDDHNNICDQDFTCLTFRPLPIPIGIGGKREICYEDQPFQWHGQLITASCIVPPCSARVELPDGSCVDSLVMFDLLEGQADTVRFDTGVCHTDEFIFRGMTIPNGREICSEAVELDNDKGCDSVFFITVRRPAFWIGWDHRTMEKELCANVVALPSCGVIDSAAFELIWYFNGTPIDTLDENECISTVTEGEYWVEPFYKERSCASGIRFSYQVVTTSTEDKVSSVIELYPNPVDERLYILSESKVEYIHLYDLTGRLHKTVKDKEVDVSDLSAGVYVVSVYLSNGAVERRQLVVK